MCSENRNLDLSPVNNCSVCVMNVAEAAAETFQTLKNELIFTDDFYCGGLTNSSPVIKMISLIIQRV